MTTTDDFGPASPMETPRAWAVMTVWTALFKASRNHDRTCVNTRIVWAVARYRWDVLGVNDRSFTETVMGALPRLLDPDMGAGLADMWEHAGFIVDSLVPEGAL